MERLTVACSVDDLWEEIRTSKISLRNHSPRFDLTLECAPKDDRECLHSPIDSWLMVDDVTNRISMAVCEASGALNLHPI